MKSQSTKGFPTAFLDWLFAFIKIMYDVIYGYTFPFDSSGIWEGSKFKIPIGQRFEYWGCMWEVEGQYLSNDGSETNEFYCKKV